MAKARIVYDPQATHMIFEGDKRNPEPPTGVITFPGGHVEVSRCSDGSYWAHLYVDEPKNVMQSRIDYKSAENWYAHGIPKVPAADDIQHIALQINNLTVPQGE